MYGRFLGIVSVFSKFWYDARIHMKFSLTAEFSPKIGKMGQKQGFLNLLKNYAINFSWICSVMKIYIICCVPARIPYLGKFWFLRYGPKCSQPIRLQDFLFNHISKTNQWNGISHKLKVDQEIFGWAWPEWVWSVWSRDSKIGCISRMNWCKELIFLQGGANSGKQKVISNDFWVGLVKNGHGHSVHETLKSAEYVYRLSWFFTCWLWCNNFLLDQHWLFFLLLNPNLLQLY